MKVYVSAPVGVKETRGEAVQLRQEIYGWVQRIYPNCTWELLDKEEPNTTDIPASVNYVSQADLVVFAKDHENSIGCRIDKYVCDQTEKMTTTYADLYECVKFDVQFDLQYMRILEHDIPCPICNGMVKQSVFNPDTWKCVDCNTTFVRIGRGRNDWEFLFRRYIKKEREEVDEDAT